MVKLGFIGTGSLGSMLIRGFIQRKAASPEEIKILNRSPEKAERLQNEFPGLAVYWDYSGLVKDSDLIFICVKPADLQNVLERTGREFPQDKIVISTLLAPPLGDLEQFIKGKLVRIYPSVTQSTGRGVTIVTWGQGITPEDRVKLQTYLNVLGKTVELPEELYRAAGDVTSCGPAFMAAMIGALAQEAAMHGIKPACAREMAVETMLGTALLLEERQLDFTDLITQVATPGGCTAEGLKHLQKDLPSIMEQVYQATCQRQEEIIRNLRQAFRVG